MDVEGDRSEREEDAARTPCAVYDRETTKEHTEVLLLNYSCSHFPPLQLAPVKD